MKAIEWWIPEDQRRKRRPYKMGVKRFLTSINVGEQKPINEEKLRYGSLRSVASRLYVDYGCKFTFRKVGGIRMVERLQ
jgi:hypothetical protein